MQELLRKMNLESVRQPVLVYLKFNLGIGIFLCSGYKENIHQVTKRDVFARLVSQTGLLLLHYPYQQQSKHELEGFLYV